MTYITEKDAHIKELEGRLVEMKIALLEAQEELNTAKEAMFDLRESCRIAQGQRNASNRHIEELQDMLARCCKNEDDVPT